MKFLQDTRQDFGEVVEIGAGLLLEQNADGIPRLSGSFGSSVAAAVEFTSVDQGAPLFDLPSSDGVRLMLWPHDIGPTDAGHAIGVESGAMWYGVGGTANFHKWYGGEDLWMSLGLNLGNAKLKIGASTSTPVTEANIMGLSVKCATNNGADFRITGFFKAEMQANTVWSIQALEGYALTTNPSGSVAISIGTIGNVEHNGAGTVTDARAIQAGVILTSGTITRGIGVYVAPPARVAGTFSTAYGIYIDAQNTAGISASYAIYSAGPSRSYVAGNVLVGEDSNPNNALIRSHIGSIANCFEADAPAGVAALYVSSKAGLLRWRWGSDGTTESGSNSGNDFKLFAYNDAGSFLGTAITVARSNFFCTIGGGIAWGGGGSISSSSLVVTTARTISAGTGLSGGGDLSANRTLSIDTSVVPQKNASDTITGALWTFSTINVNGGTGSTSAVRLFAQSMTGQSAAVFRCNDESGVAYMVVAGGSGLSDPVSIRVGGALKQLTIDGSGFIKGV